ncbi:MAG TPA: M1 family metallopeptidase [Candidatus Angelobacter sp.]|nr:M1 family metallopeptidase [Candidatus Angelobacter sp.]
MTVANKWMWTVLFLLPVVAGAQRLPETIVPQHYDLSFTPDLQKATFTGEETIEVQVASRSLVVVLNALELEIQQAEVTQGDKPQIAQVSFQPEKEQVTLALPAPLEPGPATVHIKFSGILNDKLRGFYLSKTKLRNYATTQFESTDARRAFPSFDEPLFKAKFDITLIVDKDDTAISNGRIIADVSGPGPDKHTIKFSTTARMSSYLVAMAVGDFKCSESTADNIPIRVCGTPDKQPLQAAALRYAGEILKFYDQYYGIPYPFTKLDVLGLPDFEAGAMENTAAIFYRESLLFIDDSNASVGSRQAVFEVLAHEMAHQWFGDLVTMKWWDNTWLNEGFATWMELKPSQSQHPEWNAAVDAVKANNKAMELDAVKSTRAIRAHADTRDQIEEMFDPISYEKAAAILRMAESYVSPEVFRRGVNAYLRKFAYGNATAEDFWTALTMASGRPVDRIMKAFIDQPGVPLIQVKTACVTPPPQPAPRRKGRRARKPIQPHPKTEVTLTQQRFTADGSTGSEKDPLFLVPVCIKTSDNKPFCQLAGDRKQVVPVVGCSPWVFTNAGAFGYYRTQYDADDFRKVTQAITTGLTTAERVTLVNDESALAQSGREKMGSFLELVGKLNSDQEHSVAESYLPALRRINDYLLTDADRDLFHAWVRTTFRPMFDKVGWTPAAAETDDMHQLRANLIEILGAIGEDPEIIGESTRRARQYLQSPASVDPTLARPLLAVAARFGNADLLQEYTASLENMKSPEQLFNVGLSLSAFRDPQLIERVLQFSLSPAVRSQDSMELVISVLNRPAASATAWPWIKEHWPDLQKKLPDAALLGVIESAGYLCDPAARADMQQFFAGRMQGNERLLQQSLERIDACINYRAHQQGDLAGWLQQHAAGTSAAR